jgi:hypothetical protein
MTEPGRTGYAGAARGRELPVARTGQKAPMSTAPDVLTDLDRRITAAHRHLGVARARFSAAPSGEGLTVCEAAEAALDDLLDQRLQLVQDLARPAVA